MYLSSVSGVRIRVWYCHHGVSPHFHISRGHLRLGVSPFPMRLGVAVVARPKVIATVANLLSPIHAVATRAVGGVPARVGGRVLGDGSHRLPRGE
jgi:hypothetical protein